MRPQLKAILKLTAVVLLLLVAVVWAGIELAGCRRAGDQEAAVWFYDQSEKRLYTALPDIPPPDKGVGGKQDDGVRAVVVAFRGAKSDSRNRRIAYLQTYTPELKSLLERVRAARVARRTFDGRIPSRDSDYFQTNTLVSRVEPPDWHSSSSPQGQRIMIEWRAWRGPDGQPPVMAVP